MIQNMAALKTGARTDFECGYKLRECDQKEIEIEKELELFVEYDG